VIFFYNTYDNIGGAENLIYSILEYGSTYNTKFGLIGPDKGYLFERLNRSNIDFQFINFSVVDSYEFFNENDIIIFFANFYGIESLKKFPGKVAIWAILFSSIVGWNRFVFETKIFKKNIFSHFFNRHLIKSLIDKNSLFVMDGNVSKAISDYISYNQKIIPFIPIPIRNNTEFNEYSVLKKCDKDHLTITYIGRGNEIWKVKPIKKVINDLRKSEIKFKVTIFTDDENLYLKEIQNFNNEIEFLFGFYGESLDKKLLELSDIHFSMGTSALEASKLGIPTILLDASVYDFPDNYKYNWIFKSKNFGLGTFISEACEYLYEGLTMNEIIFLARNNPQLLIEIGEKCRIYTNQNHNINNVCNLLLQINPKMRIAEILRYTPASWFN
jgi:hypothetical protein